MNESEQVIRRTFSVKRCVVSMIKEEGILQFTIFVFPREAQGRTRTELREMCKKAEEYIEMEGFAEQYMDNSETEVRFNICV